MAEPAFDDEKVGVQISKELNEKINKFMPARGMKSAALRELLRAFADFLDKHGIVGLYKLMDGKTRIVLFEDASSE